MPITTLAALVLGLNGPLPPIYCPATLEKITGAPAQYVDYGGILFETCCAGCGNPLLKDPRPLLAEAIKNKKTVGQFEFDPVSGGKIEPLKAATFSDYKSIRYFFTSKEEKKTFDASPGTFITNIKSTAYFCPVNKQPVDPNEGGAFADYNGTRYFLCCTNCLKQFKADPAKFAANAAAAVKPLIAIDLKK